MIITLRNNFHRTESRVRVKALPAIIKGQQMRRVSKELCGMKDCRCETIRGPQDVAVMDHWDKNDRHCWKIDSHELVDKHRGDAA